MAVEDSPRAVNALLKEALGRCQRVLDQRPPDEVELREALCWIKMAHSAAEPTLVLAGGSLMSTLLDDVLTMVGELLRPLRGLNP